MLDYGGVAGGGVGESPAIWECDVSLSLSLSLSLSGSYILKLEMH